MMTSLNKMMTTQLLVVTLCLLVLMSFISASPRFGDSRSGVKSDRRRGGRLTNPKPAPFKGGTQSSGLRMSGKIKDGNFIVKLAGQKPVVFDMVKKKIVKQTNPFQLVPEED
ncbi:unnamed protein product [Owenia fusiformis]|uniref:Uncharacterized protein n=1 Tax=Owenia fusiformis TaxID=6347 RepID=A0A8S4MWC6_OWEFU|nr:unnamed protein product [Owenia fusiformis]